MSGDEIAVQYEQVEHISLAITTFCNQMDEDLARVNRACQQLVSQGWQGMSANAFHAQQQKWNSGAEHMKQTLAQLAQKVGDANAHFQQTESAATQMFM